MNEFYEELVAKAFSSSQSSMISLSSSNSGSGSGSSIDSLEYESHLAELLFLLQDF